MRTVAGTLGVAVAVLIALLGASSYPGCAIYNSSLIGAGDAGDPDARIGGDAGGGCAHAFPPARPLTTDDGGGPDIPPVIAAFRTIDIGVAGDVDAAIPPFGYDLDGVCTCPGPPSCTQPKGAQRGQDCDDEAGRDNTDIQLFRLLRGPASTGTSQIDQSLTAGQYGLLLAISNYNGNQDDSKVTVDFYVSNGLTRSADGGLPTPRFDGSDLWTIDPLSIGGGMAGGGAVYTDPSAYVSGGYVVAHMSQLPIAFGDRSFLGGARILLFEAVIVGQLQLVALADGGSGYGFALAGGTIAGRWPTHEVLSTLATIPEEGGFLCGNDSLVNNVFKYNVVKTVICEAADISTVSQNDNATPTLAPCDAISVGMQFTAVPAQLGPVFAVPAAPAGCQDGGISWSDHCGQ